METKFDIKQIGPVPPPYGGVSVYINRLVSSLSNDGFKVGGYYTSDCVANDIVSSPAFDKWTWYETHKYPIKIWKFLSIAKKYKILHSHCSLELMAYLWTAMALLKKQIIVTIHNSMIVNSYKNTNCINRFFLNRMLRSEKVIWITVSEEGKEQLNILYNKFRNPIQVIPAYIPIEQGEYIELCSSMQAYINSHEKIISFYGHSFMLNEGIDIYGFETALKMYAAVYKRNKKIGMVFCLSDTKDQAKIKALHVLANKLKIDDVIYWQIGPINNINSLWKQTDIYIRPTSTDGDSVAVREVLDEGAIVIASDVCPRPNNVITYTYDDLNDFISKVEQHLSLPRKSPHYNYEPYFKMKNLYHKILKR